MGLLSSLGTARAGSLVRAMAPDQHGGAAGGSMSLFSGALLGGFPMEECVKNLVRESRLDLAMEMIVLRLDGR